MLYRDCPDPPAFLAELRSRTISTAILAWRQEYGPVAEANGEAVYRAVRSLTLLAYDGGTIIRCELEDERADRAAARSLLVDAGIRVEERSRNLS